MAAYYTWVNQQRLPGADQAAFLVWFEDHQEAVVIAAESRKGKQSEAPTDLRELVASVTSTK
jgi:hypothetical protein